MSAYEINHVSVLATDLEESVAFYRDVFGMEPIPSPNFEAPVEWLRCGDQQLHLFERDVDPPAYHHFGMTVEDFPAVYEAAVDRELFAGWDDESSANVYRLPDDSAQMYLRDPSGNLIEVNHPDVDGLPQEIRDDVTDRAELIPQTGEAARATLEIDSTGED